MRALYVAREGATLRREGNLLQIHARGEQATAVPVHDLQQLVLMGNVQITPAALDLLVERGIDTVLLTRSGRYRARVVSSLSRNVHLRLAQYRAMTDGERVLKLAKEIVAGKALNQRALLLRYARRHGLSEPLATAAVAIRASVERLQWAADLDAVRGCEGAASAAYFRAFGGLLRAEGFHFPGRNRRPPMDPVNAMLSLGYTLLANVVEAAIEVVGLDPYLGALHAPETGRPSLACDLMEEFRAGIADSLVVGAVNKGVIGPGDFEDAGPGEPVVMKREAVRVFVGLFERRMERPTRYAPLGNQLPWRQVVEQQVRRLARELLGEESYACHRLE